MPKNEAAAWLMMRPTWVLALLVAAALAGCADTDEEPLATETMEDEVGGEAPPPVFGPHSGLPLERPGDWLPRLDAPPQWVQGEWWTVEATSAFDGQQYSIKRIVVGKEGPDYLVGMPIDAFDDEIMVLHHPGMGLVQADTLGYETHDFMFEPLQFPLEEGASWTSLWQSATGVVTHTVESVDLETRTATITMTGQQSGTYTYDADLGAISEFNAPGYMSWKVTGHGFGHEGIVRVPHGHDMTMFHGRVGPLVPIVQSQGAVQQATGSAICPPNVNTCADVAGPMETFVIPDEYDRASFSLILIDVPAFVGGAPASAGAYQITAAAPDGTTFEAQHLPTDGALTIQTHALDNPGGEWQLTTIVGGAGQVFIEGVTYVTFDVVMPEGCVLLTSDVHDHGGDCGGHVHDIE